jgi:hypothetical protein
MVEGQGGVWSENDEGAVGAGDSKPIREIPVIHSANEATLQHLSAQVGEDGLYYQILQGVGAGDLGLQFTSHRPQNDVPFNPITDGFRQDTVYQTDEGDFLSYKKKGEAMRLVNNTDEAKYAVVTFDFRRQGKGSWDDKEAISKFLAQVDLDTLLASPAAAEFLKANLNLDRNPDALRHPDGPLVQALVDASSGWEFISIVKVEPHDVVDFSLNENCFPGLQIDTSGPLDHNFLNTVGPDGITNQKRIDAAAANPNAPFKTTKDKIITGLMHERHVSGTVLANRDVAVGDVCEVPETEMVTKEFSASATLPTMGIPGTTTHIRHIPDGATAAMPELSPWFTAIAAWELPDITQKPAPTAEEPGEEPGARRRVYLPLIQQVESGAMAAGAIATATPADPIVFANMKAALTTSQQVQTLSMALVQDLLNGGHITAASFQNGAIISGAFDAAFAELQSAKPELFAVGGRYSDLDVLPSAGFEEYLTKTYDAFSQLKAAGIDASGKGTDGNYYDLSVVNGTVSLQTVSKDTVLGSNLMPELLQEIIRRDGVQFTNGVVDGNRLSQTVEAIYTGGSEVDMLLQYGSKEEALKNLEALAKNLNVQYKLHEKLIAGDAQISIDPAVVQKAVLKDLEQIGGVEEGVLAWSNVVQTGDPAASTTITTTSTTINGSDLAPAWQTDITVETRTATTQLYDMKGTVQRIAGNLMSGFEDGVLSTDELRAVLPEGDALLQNEGKLEELRGYLQGQFGIMQTLLASGVVLDASGEPQLVSPSTADVVQALAADLLDFGADQSGIKELVGADPRVTAKIQYDGNDNTSSYRANVTYPKPEGGGVAR